MGAQTNVAPVIIKRKKVVGGGGHHGGAWKVAYADFVTAMMAFFMLMWLLNATTEKQRKGLADYFSPTIPINRVSGGGDGAFGGTNMFSEETMINDGTGATARNPMTARQSRGLTGLDQSGFSREELDSLSAVEDLLQGRGGESLVSVEARKHVVTRVTDEGLVIELFATDDAPLFVEGTDHPTALLRELAKAIVQAADLVINAVAVGGHIRAHPVVLAKNPVWDLSTARASRTRKLLEASGLDAQRVHRVTGHADRKLAVRDPMANRNSRIEVILLRKSRP